ncbi:MAG: hypothetical protein PF518_01935 [Spirochaetaceae bacterium]|jgi:hypothetical protein|nr:hypothetical protein [Spirochaetaceae bacterium]
MQFKRVFLLSVSLIFLLQLPVYSQDSVSEEAMALNPNPVDFGFGIGLGAVNLDGKVYNSIILNPDLSIGKFGIALDINFRFTLTGDDPGETTFSVYEPDWYLRDGTVSEYLNLYLSKFDYIRWGQSGDDLFIKLGSLENVTIGNGFIVGGYTNEMFKPIRKYTGARFELDTDLFNWPYMGVEFFVNNVSAWDVLATRLYAKPIAGIESPVFSGLEVGLTFAVDSDPYFHLREDINNNDYWDIADSNTPIFIDPLVSAMFSTSYNPESVFVYGVDVMQPLVDIKMFSMAMYGDFAMQGFTAPAIGGSTGFGGTLIKFLTWNGGLIFRGDDFIPSYFNRTYDLDRGSKYIQYANPTTDVLQDAGIDYKTSVGLTFLDGGLTFVTQITGPFAKPVIKDPTNAPWEYPHLMALLNVGEGIIPYFDMSFWYDKQGIDSLSALVNPTNALIGGRLNYRIQRAVLSLQVDVKYDPSDAGDWLVTTKLETGIQF